MSREGAMISKLKEGLQEAVDFLRQLGDFKIPAVMETRRKKLLDILVDLQGDTKPSHDKPDDKASFTSSTEKLKSQEPVVRREKEEVTSPQDSVMSPAGGSPTKRLSRGDSKITALVGNYEHNTIVAKQAEVAETPKRFMQLKKVAKPTYFPDAEKDKEEALKEEEKDDTTASATAELSTEKGKENGTLKAERPSSMVSEESVNTEPPKEEEEEEAEEVGEKETGKKKGKFGRFKKIGKLGDKLKKKQKGGRDKTPSRAMEDEDDKSGVSDIKEPDSKERAATPPELEEGVTIVGTLERKVTSRLQTRLVKVYVKLQDNVLPVTDKERISLAGFIKSADTDGGFDIVNHATKKQIHFLVEAEGEESTKEEWVEAINTAIEESTPKQEDKLKSKTQERCQLGLLLNVPFHNRPRAIFLQPRELKLIGVESEWTDENSFKFNHVGGLCLANLLASHPGLRPSSRG